MRKPTTARHHVAEGVLWRFFIVSPFGCGGFSKAQGGISSAVAKRSMFDNDTFQRERSTADT